MTSITDGAIAQLFETITLTDYVAEEKKSPAPPRKETTTESSQKIQKTIMLFPDDFELTANKDVYTFYKNILKAIQLPESAAEKLQEGQFNESLLKPGTFMICWGTKFGSDEAKYDMISTKSGGKFLYTDHLNHVSVDKIMKTKLWQQIKPIYNV